MSSSGLISLNFVLLIFSSRHLLELCSKIEAMSSANRSKNFESGCQKHKKKQRIEDLIQSQKGAMDRFVTKQSQVSSDNPRHLTRGKQLTVILTMIL